MENKARRNYSLLIEKSDGNILNINPPFTVEFDVTRNLLSSVNTATIKIYNLNQTTRADIYKDIYDFLTIRSVEFRAGYGPPTTEQAARLARDNIDLGYAYTGTTQPSFQLPIAFKGNIGQAWSTREGVNFITTIEGYDGGYAFVNGEVNTTWQAGKSNQDILADILGSLPGTTVGKIGNFPGKTTRATAVSGSAQELASTYSGGGFFIDNTKAYCLNNDECIAGSIQVINSASGLLGTPVREKTIVKFEMLFEPRLMIGQIVDLQAGTVVDPVTGELVDAGGSQKIFNGLYKVVSLKHTGMISEAIAGEAITTVGLWKGTEILKVI